MFNAWCVFAVRCRLRVFKCLSDVTGKKITADQHHTRAVPLYQVVNYQWWCAPAIWPCDEHMWHLHLEYIHFGLTVQICLNWRHLSVECTHMEPGDTGPRVLLSKSGSSPEQTRSEFASSWRLWHSPPSLLQARIAKPVSYTHLTLPTILLV